MTIIHMETEQVQEAARLLRQLNGDLDGAIIALRRAKERLAMAWSGESAVSFETELQVWIAGCTRQSIALTDLVRRLGVELEEWQQADASLSLQGMEMVEVNLTEFRAGWSRISVPTSVRVVNDPQEILRTRLPAGNRRTRIVTIPPLGESGGGSGRPKDIALDVAPALSRFSRPPIDLGLSESGLGTNDARTDLQILLEEAYVAKTLDFSKPMPVAAGSTASLARGMAGAQTEAQRRQSFLQTDQGRRLFGSLDPRLRDQIPGSYFSEGTRGVSVEQNGRVRLEYTTYAGRGQNRSPIGSRQAVLNLVPPSALPSQPQGEIVLDLRDLDPATSIPGFGDAELFTRPLDISSTWALAVQTQRLQVQQTQQVVSNITRMMHDMQASVIRKIG